VGGVIFRHMKITVKQLRTIIKEEVEMSQIDSLVDELNHVDWSYEYASGRNYYEGRDQVYRALDMLKKTSPEILQSLRDYYSDPGNRGPSMGSNKDVLLRINHVMKMR